MRNLIRRILNAFKRTLRALTGVIVYSVNFATGLLQSAFRRAEYDEAPEEIVSEAIDAKVEEKVGEKAQPPAARLLQDGTLAQRVKNALLATDAGRPVAVEFDLARPDHRAALEWFGTLDEGHLRALRHMPMTALGAHLHPKFSVKAHGLPRFPVVANENAPSIDEAFEPIQFRLAEAQPRP